MMLALSIALSFVVIYKMPLGGSVTLFSMLPVMLVSVRHGLKWGLPTAFIYSLFQFFTGLILIFSFLLQFLKCIGQMKIPTSGLCQIAAFIL